MRTRSGARRGARGLGVQVDHLKNHNFERGVLSTGRNQVLSTKGQQADVFNLHRLTAERPVHEPLLEQSAQR